MAGNEELLAAVGKLGKGPSGPTPNLQPIASPSTISPGDGARVDEGAPIVPTSINGNGEAAPTGPNPNPNPNAGRPNPNPNPNAGKSSGGKKSSTKTILLSSVIVIGLFGIILLLVLGKGNGGAGGDILPTPTTTPTTGNDIVQDWVEYDDPFGLGGGDDWVVTAFTYTEEELADLRRVGYTGTEIEAFALEEKPATELIEAAEKAREEYLEETIEPYYKGRSEKFKKLEASTWVGLEEVDVDAIPDVNEEFWNVTTENVTINTDYEKVEARGHQLFLKIYIDDEHEDWVYYQCTYQEYAKLKESGNIVVVAKIHSYVTEDTEYHYWEIEGVSIY